MTSHEAAAESSRQSSPAVIALTKSAIVALAIAFVPQGVWSALIVANLRTVPAIPWSVLMMTVLLGIGAQFLGGRWGSSATAAARRRSLRATVVSREMFAWAWLAGGLAIVALVAVWIILASFVRMPGSALPDMSPYPRFTAVLAIAMGALVSPLCEQAGLWGYWQGELERRWSGATAIVVTSLVFALLPHPPAGVAFGPKVLFFFLAGLIFSTMAYLTNSILPAIPVHGLGLLVFFALVWPNDPPRPLVATSGTDAWFWIHVVQIVVFAALAFWAFGQLGRLHNVVARKF